MKPNPDDPLYWKDRYQNLLKESELLRDDWEENQKLLIRTIIRLTQATHGLDPALDPHLTSIREMMRQNVPIITLEKELDALLETLLHAPKSDLSIEKQAPGLELLRFFEFKYPSPENLPALRELRRRIESGELSSEDAVFNQIGQFKPVCAETINPVAQADDRLLRLRLGELLKTLNVPTAIAERRRMILIGIVKRTEEILPLFDMTTALVAELTKLEKAEQKQLRDFLAELSQKLADLEEKAQGVNLLAESSAKDQQSSNQAVSDQVADLMTAASSSTNLGQLKELISTKLEGISSRLSSNQNEGEVRLLQTQQQIEQLTHRLQVLEQESDDLRAKLILANDHESIDTITKLPNKVAFLQRMTLEEKRWKRFKQPLSLAIFDLDYFKKINERFGRPTGDKILIVISKILVAGIRDTDFICRLGGDQFALLLIGADEIFAEEVTEVIRKRIESFEFVSESRPVPITISCGISQFKGHDTDKDVFKRAEAALREAKQKGRNRSLISKDY